MSQYVQLQGTNISPLNFLINRQISWSTIDYEDETIPNCYPIYRHSGIITHTRNDLVWVRKLDDGKEVLLPAMTLAQEANEKCIRAVMMKCMMGAPKRLLEDQTLHEVYGLIDPRDNLFHYIGISKNAQSRYRQHLRCEGENASKNAWIQELKNLGLVPIRHTIEQEVKGKFTALLHEEYWIEYYTEQGYPLTNWNFNESIRNGGTRIDDPELEASVLEQIAREVSLK